MSRALSTKSRRSGPPSDNQLGDPPGSGTTSELSLTPHLKNSANNSQAQPKNQNVRDVCLIIIREAGLSYGDQSRLETA
jgi:hypothetical protein